MKTFLASTVVFLILFLMITGCQDKASLTGLKSREQTNVFKNSPDTKSGTFPLIADQNNPVGSVIVSNEMNSISVTFDLMEGWVLKETHVHVAEDLNGIPHNKNGIPIPGHFAYSMQHNPFISKYTYSIPLLCNQFTPGDPVIIAAHAVVQSCSPCGTVHEATAWGGDLVGCGPRWWFYINYTFEGEICTFHSEPAMVRMYDDPFNLSFPWLGHPWFTYVVAAPHYQDQTYYLYAREKEKVGIVTMVRVEDELLIHIFLNSPYEMKESHVNIQLYEYMGIPDFSLFPYAQIYDPHVTSTTYHVPWDPKWEGQKLFIAVHGEVGPF